MGGISNQIPETEADFDQNGKVESPFTWQIQGDNLVCLRPWKIKTRSNFTALHIFHHVPTIGEVSRHPKGDVQGGDGDDCLDEVRSELVTDLCD